MRSDAVTAEDGRSENLLKRFFNSSLVGMALTSPDKGWVEANDRLCQILGYAREDLVKLTWADLTHPDDLASDVERFDHVLAGDYDEYAIEKRFIRRDGQTVYARLYVTCVRRPDRSVESIIAVIEDITEQTNLENRLRHAEKMEAIGTLAGGIAHDFNNILAAIDGNIDLALEDLPASATDLHGFLMAAMKATRRAKDLVQQILAFSRRSPTEHRPIDLALIVKEVAKLVRASLPATIEIETRIAPLPIVVNGDATRIHQVLMNLCTNAYHAMRDSGGTLAIALDSEVRNEESGAPVSGVYAKISVRDTGVGIEESLIPRIFEPYFTTKPKGEGTGMGLAAVHGIVENHGGFIRVTSEVSRGSTFEVLLPMVADCAEDEGDFAPEIEPSGNGERILFVDDEQSILDVGVRVLERLNFRVVSCTGSQEALELFRAAPDSFDVVITDQTMPWLTGLDMAREMLRIRPGTPIILCTGYSEKVTESIVNEAGIRELLIKPVFAPVLARALDRLLHGPS